MTECCELSPSSPKHPTKEHKKKKEIERKQESSEEEDAIEKVKKRRKRKREEQEQEKLDEIIKEIGTQNYKIISLLGVGSQGRVYLVRFNGTENLYAMKVFKKDRVCSNPKTTRSVLTEQKFLATTNHPFITKLYHSFHSHERLFMVMEYCCGGELWTTIRKQPYKRLNEEQVSFYASEVLLVLEYIHFRGFIYRDLKPENILLQADGHIRMADFGLSKQADEIPQATLIRRKIKKHFFSRKKKVFEFVRGEVVRTNSLVGSIYYLAPEVLSVNSSYDVMADWWAFGVLLYDMFYGFPPFQGQSNEEIIMKIVHCNYEFPKEVPISNSLKRLIKGLLKLDPKKRICYKRGANDLKEHEFFKGVDWNLLRNRKPPIYPKVKDNYDISNFELYEGDEDSITFDFFSQLEENPFLITEAYQKQFESFNFCSDSFSSFVRQTFMPPEPKLRRHRKRSKSKRKKHRRHKLSHSASTLIISASAQEKQDIAKLFPSPSFPELPSACPGYFNDDLEGFINANEQSPALDSVLIRPTIKKDNFGEKDPRRKSIRKTGSSGDLHFS